MFNSSRGVEGPVSRGQTIPLGEVEPPKVAEREEQDAADLVDTWAKTLGSKDTSKSNTVKRHLDELYQKMARELKMLTSLAHQRRRAVSTCCSSSTSPLNGYRCTQDRPPVQRSVQDIIKTESIEKPSGNFTRLTFIRSTMTEAKNTATIPVVVGTPEPKLSNTK
ncbi:hypothetical protein AAG570_009422 [Ranatra chinensis]|uniref:Uncharacterized protein n=1 Tax=Ranatra chinensis TaxID=642074 RepID=A0ABD0YP40_9HEMI